MNTISKDIVICHFSDLHVVPNQRVPWFSLLNKRILGYGNLKLNRGKTHKEAFLLRLMEKVASEKADMTVITGDFTSLSLDFEFARIGRMLKDCGLVPERTMVIPGNHDRYTYLADKQRAFERGMADWLPEGFFSRPEYPIVKRLGHVCLMGLDTAVWRGPVRAAGAIDDLSIARMKETLTSEEMKSLAHLIAVHHPPFHRGNHLLKDYRTGFVGKEKLIEAIPKEAVVIHGHTHIASRRKIGVLDVIGVPSASNNTGNPSTQLAYNKYTFAKDGAFRAEAHRLWPKEDGEIAMECTMVPDDMEASRPLRGEPS